MNRRGFLSAFGITSVAAVATGLRPEQADPTPQPTDQLRVEVNGVLHDVLVVPSKSPRIPPVITTSRGGNVTLSDLKGFMFNPAPQITMHGPVTVKPDTR